MCENEQIRLWIKKREAIQRFGNIRSVDFNEGLEEQWITVRVKNEALYTSFGLSLIHVKNFLPGEGERSIVKGG